MAKIYLFPTKLIPPKPVDSAGKSDMMLVIDELIINCKSTARSHGFMIGILVANIQHIVVQYFFK